MKYFAWDEDEQREAEEGTRHWVRGLVFHIERGDLLDILEHPNAERYAGQRILSSDARAMCTWCRLWTRSSPFLKTIIPSRKATNSPRPGA